MLLKSFICMFLFKKNNNNKINKIGEGVKLVVGTAFLKIKIKNKITKYVEDFFFPTIPNFSPT